MTLSLKVDDVYLDLVITNGSFETVTGADEVKQRILIHLNHYYNEYFLKVPEGVPYYEVIFGSKSIEDVKLVLRSEILQLKNVIGIASFNVSWSDTIERGLDISMIVEVESNYTTTTIAIETTVGG